MTGECDPLINIQLTEYEAKAFVQFQKHYKDFMALYEGGVFSIRNGNAILHFDGAGTLDDVDFHIKGFKKGLPIVQKVVFIPVL